MNKKRLLGGIGMLAFAAVAMIMTVLPSKSASVYRLGAEAQGAAAAVSAGSGEWPARITNSTAIVGTNAIFNTPNGKEMLLQFSGKLNDAGTANIGIGISQSVDGNKWQVLRLVGIAANGNTEVTLCTNITINAANYLKFYITNAEATSMITGYQAYINIR